MKRLGIVGCGFLGNIIANAWKQGLLEEYELVGVTSRSWESAEKTAQNTGVRACRDIDELLALKPDFVAEAASVQTVRDITEKVLNAGSDLVVLSIGAFAQDEFREKALDTARRTGHKIHIASGAIGGFDVLRTMHVMSLAGYGPLTAGIQNTTCPEALERSPLFRALMEQTGREGDLFEGSAKEAIELLPSRVNVAVATSLATAGPANTRSKITSQTGVVGDYQHIIAQIQGVKADLDIYASTSAIAGWSVVALLRNLSSPMMFQ